MSTTDPDNLPIDPSEVTHDPSSSETPQVPTEKPEGAVGDGESTPATDEPAGGGESGDDATEDEFDDEPDEDEGDDEFDEDA